jgi:hypothetical protein
MGGGDGSGFYGLLNQFAGQQVGSGDGQYSTRPDIEGAIASLGGNQMMEAYGGGNEVARWLQDAQGNITGAPEISSLDDDNFGYAALAAAALATAGAAGAFGGGGAAGGAAGATGGAGSGIGTLGTIAPGSSALAPLATTGLASTAPAITATIPQISGGLLAAGAAGSYAPATNAALAESAAGTAGYGASSAGAGGGAGQVAGSSLGSLGTGLLDYIKANPKIVGSLAGGLLGATGGMSEGASDAPYTGPMPTITRGGWQPRAQAQMMALPTFGQGLNTAQGNANSGLWRFMGGK